MKIGIVTVYEPTTNMGSFLQAYALKKALEKLGHEVYIIQNISTIKEILKLVMRVNPKREFFLRLKKAWFAKNDIKKLKLLNKSFVHNLDGLVYGSDEIWNLDNPYFMNGFFWGKDIELPKISYAVSMGAMDDEKICKYKSFVESIKEFRFILVRDIKTQRIIKKIRETENNIVCDPTMLIPIEELTENIKPLKYKYILVYTYGIDALMIEYIRKFSDKYGLKIVSVCFWHIWADVVIECSALNFSSYIKNAEFVFTTTFHGAVFSMLNHKRCCIFPYRSKVKNIVEQMGEESHLVENNCTYEEFETTIQIKFDSYLFEERLEKYRRYSQKKLEEALKCLIK